jgi:tRNA (guanosine-2'-O-)-methyltransferase
MATPRRLYRISQAIHQRQQDLIIALDQVHDQHNLSAVMRTADAVGVGKIIWEPDVVKPETVNPEVSLGTERWVSLKVVSHLKQELQALKKQGYKIAATHMAREAVDFRSIDWTEPWVVVFGNEHRGCCDTTVEVADANIFMPMLGFVQSLNISVAAAVTLYEIQRQRELKGMYAGEASKEQVLELYEQWKLAENNLQPEELYKRVSGQMPELEAHSDGRKYNKFFHPEKK